MARTKKPAPEKAAARKPARKKVEPIALGAAAAGIRQPTQITALAVSPHGTQIATGDGKGRVRVFDTPTGACVFETTWHSHERRDRYGIQRLAFSRDGAVITALTGINGSGNLCACDLATGATWFETRDSYDSYALSPDGTRIACLKWGHLEIVDARDGTIRAEQPHQGLDEVAWSLDGAHLVASYRDEDTTELTWLGCIDPETLAITKRTNVGYLGGRLWFAPDGQVVALVYGDRDAKAPPRVIRFDPSTGRHDARPIAGDVGSARYNRPALGPRFALVTGQDAAYLVDLAAAAVARTLPPDVQLVATSADGSVVVTVHGASLQLRDAALEPRSGDAGLTTAIAAIGFTADGDVVTCDQTGIRTWSSSDGAARATLATGNAVDLSPDASLALVVRADTTSVVELPSGRARTTMAVAKRYGTMSPDGRLLLTRNNDEAKGCVLVVSTETGALVHELDAHAGYGLYGVGFSLDGALIASGSWNGRVAVDDARSGEEVMRAHADGSWGQQSFSFQPGNKLLASGDHRRTVRLWRLPDGKLLHTLRGHRRSVIEATVFSPDGALLASADEADVRVWNVRTGAAVGVARVGAYAIAFSPDGKRLAVGGSGAAWIFDVASMAAPK